MAEAAPSPDVLVRHPKVLQQRLAADEAWVGGAKLVAHHWVAGGRVSWAFDGFERRRVGE